MPTTLQSDQWLTPYGALLVVGLILCWWLARRNANSAGIDPSNIDLLLPMAFTVAVFVTVVLGHLFEVDRYVSDNLAVERRSRLIHLLAVAAVVALVYARMARLSVRTLFDSFAVPVLLGLAVLRIGCFITGCCWGVATEDPGFTSVTYPSGSWAWWQQVSDGLILPTATESLPVHPVQLYEAGALIAVATYLHLRGSVEPGSHTMFAVVAYALIRTGLEPLRGDFVPVFAGGSLTQVECLVLATIVVLAISARSASDAFSQTPRQ